MVVVAWFKTAALTAPQPWTTPLLWLHRTNAECMWEGLGRVLPFGPFNEKYPLPARTMVTWLWLIFICDSAASNLRLINHAEQVALAMRGGVLTFKMRCLIHLLHRAVVHMIGIGNVANQLYRSAHLFQLSSYRLLVKKNTQVLLKMRLQIVHNMLPSAEDLQVSRQILLLAMHGGEGLESFSAKERKIFEQALRHFVGDWSSHQITFLCDGRCEGDETRCKEMNSELAWEIVEPLLYSHKMVIPAAARWWKVSPTARQNLLGLAFFRIWARAAPSSYKPERHQTASAEVEESFRVMREAIEEEKAHDPDFLQWQEIFGWRVRKNHEFYNNGNTVVDLLVKK